MVAVVTLQALHLLEDGVSILGKGLVLTGSLLEYLDLLVLLNDVLQ